MFEIIWLIFGSHKLFQVKYASLETTFNHAKQDFGQEKKQV